MNLKKSPVAPARRAAVLIVDDDSLLLRALRRALRKRTDWDVTFVDGVHRAERAMEARPFDVIVTDFRMARPGTDVLAFARRHAPNAIRVMMSSAALDATRYDADLVLEKPVPLRDFEAMLTSAVARSQAAG